MVIELATGIKAQDIFTKSTMKEYSLVIDGVIEMQESLDEESFFDGLLDAIIEYVEKYDAFAGLSMSHREYVEGDRTRELDGEETA